MLKSIPLPHTAIGNYSSNPGISNDTGTIPPGYIDFYDHYLPSLDAGTYRIRVEQGISNLSTGSYFQPIEQTFKVQGPQFTLDPTEIHAMSPPNNSNGIYGNVLPHVVLERRVIPWERLLVNNDQSIPWVALLILQDNEVITDPKTGSPIFTTSVSDLLADETDIIKPDINISTLTESELAASCHSIILDSDTFHAVCPRLEELAYLCHVREVNINDQAEASDTNDSGWFSVVLANRFPQTAPLESATSDGAQNYAVLVSLEGLTSYLSDESQFPKTFIQLAVLTSWSFVAVTQAGKSFAELMDNLANSTTGGTDSQLLRLPIEGHTNTEIESDSYVADTAISRLQQGYIPLSYLTTTGEDSFAWYRGPCVPMVPEALPSPKDGFSTSAAAMIYDPNFGIFDQSYASAWQIGRMTALADANFATTLLQLRRKAINQLQTIHDQLSLGYQTDSNLESCLQQQCCESHLNHCLSQGMGQQLTDLFSQLPNTSNIQNNISKNYSKHSINTIKQCQQLLHHPEIESVISNQVITETQFVAHWLAKLVLLNFIPFNHLVPDQRMLPVESIRFFYLDPQWLHLAISGALSIGLFGSRETQIQQLLEHQLWQCTCDSIHNACRSNDAPIPGLTGEPIFPKAGILLRSAVVSGWPGLQVQGFAGSEPVSMVRMDRLSENILLCLFLDVPDTIQISEPQQSLRFGVADGELIALRNLTPPVGHPTGSFFPPTGQGNITKFFRAPETGDRGDRVLQLFTNTTGISDNYLINSLNNIIQTNLSPATFAIEMVQSPEQTSFFPTQQ